MFVYHPTAGGQRVLQAYPQARPFLEALAASPDGFVREASAVLGADVEDPFALVRKTRGWWVVAEVPDGEAMASQRRVTMAVQVFKLSRASDSESGRGGAPRHPPALIRG